MADNISEEAKHYQNLTSYFKYLVTLTALAITIITGVAIFFTFDNISGAREEVRSNLSDIDKDIKQVTQKSISSIETLQMQAEQEVENFKNEIRTFALTETKTKVDEAFEENRIRELIESTAEKKLKEKLEIIVKDQVAITQSNLERQLKVVPNIILAIDKIRNGERAGIIQLDSLRLFSADALIKDLSNNAFIEKAKDYQVFYKGYADDKSLKDYRDIFKIDTTITDKDKTLLQKSIVKFIQTNQELNDVAYAICVLNNLTAAQAYKMKMVEHPHKVKVYEKIKDGVWCYKGFFSLVDA